MEDSGDAALPPLIKALLSPACYPHPVHAVELIETHISYVLLAGDFVYKVKKAVDLGFLNFSTLQRRRHYCEEELRLNRRLAPQIYLDVIAIGGSVDAPLLGDANAIEYAVRMRRFPHSSQLDRMLEAGTLHAELLDAFAQRIAAFHAVAAADTDDTPSGDVGVVERQLAENFSALRSAFTGPIFTALLDELESWSTAQWLRHRDLLIRRKREGRVRECHGDLHLRNMAWVDEQPLVFDGIEFSEELRWIDVMNDIAFLIMDLRSRGQSRLAFRFLNRYLEYAGDYPGAALLPLFQSYRALVRAKVDTIRLAQDRDAMAETVEVERECLHYLNLAQALSRPGQPWLLITRGPSGTGKTTWTQTLVEELGAIRIRSDVERKRIFGLRIDEHPDAGLGTGMYSAEAGERTYARLLELASALLDAGFPVVVDAVFAQRPQREPFRELARRRELPFLIAEFTATPRVLRERLGQRRNDASDADATVLARQLADWQPLGQDELSSRVLIDTQQEAPGTQLLAAVRGIPAVSGAGS